MVTISRGTRDARPAPVVSAMLAPNTAHRGFCTLQPVTRPDLAVLLEMTTPVARSGGGGRWEGVDRPMRQSTQDYVGQEIERQTFGVLFEGRDVGDGEPGAPVHPAVEAFLRLRLPLPGEYAPPVLNVYGPLQGRDGAQQWQLEAAEQDGDALRRVAEGYIWSVAYTVTLALYVPIAAISLTPPKSPAAAAVAVQASSTTSTGGGSVGAAAAAKSTARTYTVKRGDTLQRIAQAQLGNASRWREIATLNAVANPNRIYPGQVFKLP